MPKCFRCKKEDFEIVDGRETCTNCGNVTKNQGASIAAELEFANNKAAGYFFHKDKASLFSGINKPTFEDSRQIRRQKGHKVIDRIAAQLHMDDIFKERGK